MKKKNKDASAEYDGSMSLSGHLRELRNRILVCVLLLLAVFALCLSQRHRNSCDSGITFGLLFAERRGCHRSRSVPFLGGLRLLL